MKPKSSPLPMKNGVAASCFSIAHGGGLLLEFLASRFPQVAQSIWLTRMAQGELRNQAGEKLHADSPCVAHSKVFYYREVSAEERIPFSEHILFQNEHLLVVDKPHFLPVTPSGQYLQETLLTRLRHRLHIEHISPIHRLDKDTAGVILFSLQPQSRGAYQSLFQTHQVHKTYHALAPTRLDLSYPIDYASCLVEDEQQFFRMRHIDQAPNSFTCISLLENRGALSLYELKPRTGRKHQLRMHMNALGMPILNDPFYPHAQSHPEADYSKPLQLLAKSLSFVDPISNSPQLFMSNLHL